MIAEARDTAGRWLRFDTSRPVDISIPLDFGGAQPNHFGADAASARPMRSGKFVGDTRRGGSCNAMELSLNPHCNGTHTECVGHVTDDRVNVAEQATDILCLARLITVTPLNSREAGERVIDAAVLDRAAGELRPNTRAVIVRTLPNAAAKRHAAYRENGDSPWYTADAARWLADRGIVHWLTDTPSIDRLHDGGKLESHRLFWGLPAASNRLADVARPHATITEMIYVDDAIADGSYVLNLQIPPFMLDAAPSRPLLYPLVEDSANA